MKFHDLLSRPFIGLDIQATCMRMLQVKSSRRGWVGERIAERKLPAEICIEGKIKHWDLLSATLIAWIEAERLTGMCAAIQVPAQLVHMQRIQLPKGLSSADILAEIGTKVKRDLPGMTDALSIDFNEIPLSADNDYMEVIFTVCRQEYLLRYKESVEASGLRVKIIDVDAYASLRAAHLDTSLSTSRGPTFFLHVTQEMAVLSVFQLHELIFNQAWEVLSRQDFLQRLNNNIELCMAVSPGLVFSKLSVSAHENIFLWLQQDLRWNERIICVDPFAHLSPAKTFDQSLVNNHFLVALGLAMREVPVW